MIKIKSKNSLLLWQQLKLKEKKNSLAIKEMAFGESTKIQ